MHDWISVKAATPPMALNTYTGELESAEVQVFDLDENGQQIGIMEPDGTWVGTASGCKLAAVTHWKPLDPDPVQA